MKRSNLCLLSKARDLAKSNLFNAAATLRSKKWEFGTREKINNFDEVGHRQSPIELPHWSKTPAENKNPRAKLHYHNPHNKWYCNFTGTTWMCQCEGCVNDHGYLSVQDGDLERKYDIVQFHFHTPAEHRLDGQELHDGEMHIVHSLRENPDGCTDDTAVVGIFLKKAEKGHTFWDELALEEGITNRNHFEINLSKFVEEVWHGAEDIYHYKGSLTTPPYSEVVNWYVARHPVPISESQLNFFRNLFGVPGNNRPLQPAYGRCGCPLHHTQ